MSNFRTEQTVIAFFLTDFPRPKTTLLQEKGIRVSSYETLSKVHLHELNYISIRRIALPSIMKIISLYRHLNSSPPPPPSISTEIIFKDILFQITDQIIQFLFLGCVCVIDCITAINHSCAKLVFNSKIMFFAPVNFSSISCKTEQRDGTREIQQSEMKEETAGF